MGNLHLYKFIPKQYLKEMFTIAKNQTRIVDQMKTEAKVTAEQGGYILHGRNSKRLNFTKNKAE